MCLTCAMFNPFGGEWLHVGELDRTIDETTLPGGDAADDADDATTLLAGDTFNGSLDVPFDWDWFFVEFEAGQTYTVTMTPGTLDDPLIGIADSEGNIRFTIDQGFSGDSEVYVFVAETSGSGYIVADSYYNTLDPGSPGYTPDTGTYSLSITSVPTPPPPPPGSFDPLEALAWGYSAPSSVNVYFAPGGVIFDDIYLGAQVTGEWDSFELRQALLAFSQFEAVADVSFTVVTDPTQADFFMVESTDPDSALGYWAVAGGSPTLDGVTYDGLEGWGVFFNGEDADWTPEGLAQGGFGYITLIHEIGHGMGLAHPHDTGGSSVVLSGVTQVGPNTHTLGHYALNQGINTTMTYNDGWQTAPHGVTPSNAYGFQGSLMAFDIAVLQATYGANMTHATGDDDYVLPTDNAPGTFYAAIWDAGGDDRIVHTGSVAAVIDLRAASLVGEENGGGHVSYVEGIHGGFTIAAGAVIEHATGGSGADTITGNAEDNEILGMAGDDVIEAGGGHDTISGGQGFDWIEGGAGNDVIRGNLNADTIHGGDGFDTLYGNFGNDLIHGGANADRIFGGDLDDELHGEAGSDFVVGQAGRDTIYGGDGFDTLRGGAGDDLLHGGDLADVMQGGLDNDTLYGEGGNDRLEGNGGNDLLDGGDGLDGLFGAAGSDTLIGGAGDDRLFGGRDGDLIDGGTGNDTMFGGFDSDVFVFGMSHGADVIRDFDANGERIDVSAFALELADLTITAAGDGAVVTGVGAGVLVTSEQGSILLEGVVLGDIGADDFLFGAFD
jgi:Ca2+-binding RTX toxin-like protein